MQGITGDRDGDFSVRPGGTFQNSSFQKIQINFTRLSLAGFLEISSFGSPLIVHYASFPCSLEKLQFRNGWWIENAFGFGGGLFASVSDESAGEAGNGDDMSKEFHVVKGRAVAGQGVRNL